ncbi:hypothetical protein K0M31_016735 [Melipona bicolor]|uniref:Up-regulated during skeletal muscle growth protein 5 n=1 Tax=Melipona bicolor TaxID=60889 RepID=A0AA40FE87_9HYME|nr:hypothetical protein K0M31_016735 [Melipona bicolor]
MASSSDSEPKLTGLSKHFNSVTDRGRANVALSTISGLVALGLYLYLKPKSNKTTGK